MVSLGYKEMKMNVMNYMQGAPNKTSETIEITYCENLNALALS
jgi:hypothetical protein